MKNEFYLREKSYYSYLDEKYFYEWLESIEGVKSVRHSKQGLHVELKEDGMSRGGVYDLVALLTRYKYEMQFVRDLIRAEDESWFREPDKYWYLGVFGGVDLV
jgi:hypothetical protein